MKEEVINEMERYSIIEEKNKREIVLLRGSGCTWRRCRFCNYHLDSCKDTNENILLNTKELQKVTGIYQKLEIINSGSFTELPEATIDLIEQVCIEKQIKELRFEAHYNQREAIPSIKERFSKNNIQVFLKIGVETFDSLFRESYLSKGITTDNPSDIACYFDEVCLLQGIPGQTKQSMIHDIETGLQYFHRVCVNIMQENGMPIKPDPRVIDTFIKEVYPLYKDNERIDILLNNTDFGVGGNEHE